MGWRKQLQKKKLNRTRLHGTAMFREWQKEDHPKIAFEVDAETKGGTTKTEEKLDGRHKEGHERKKLK